MSIPARRRGDGAAAPTAAAPPRRRPALPLASARRADGRVVTFDASGQQVSDTDGLKRVLQTKKHAAIHVSPDTTPANSHDPLKQIVTVVDDKNPTTRAASDHLGRRTPKVTTQRGGEEHSHGPLGELAKQTLTIASATQGNAANAPEVYTTQYQYDTWNRLLKMTYPDGEVPTYGYDSGGLVTAAKGVKSNYTYDYLTRLDYDKFEQRAWLEAGNQGRHAD